jgi:hypothetical protein
MRSTLARFLQLKVELNKDRRIPLERSSIAGLQSTRLDSYSAVVRV